jgi:hypothetical protein
MSPASSAGSNTNPNLFANNNRAPRFNNQIFLAETREQLSISNQAVATSEQILTINNSINSYPLQNSEQDHSSFIIENALNTDQTVNVIVAFQEQVAQIVEILKNMNEKMDNGFLRVRENSMITNGIINQLSIVIHSAIVDL